MKKIIELRTYLAYSLVVIAIALVLGGVCVENTGLPAGEMAAQWDWFAKTGILFTVSVYLAFIVYSKERNLSVDFYLAVVWVLILLGAWEAFVGIRQLYGFSYSNHSLYKMTGSFFNPGPYSGYLAMVFPLCLSEWLRLKEKSKRMWLETGQLYIAGSTMVLILCVLPAGMSRSAWLATFLSSLWVWGMHCGWLSKCKRLWKEHPKRMVGLCVLALFCVLLAMGGTFYLKKDSANGRLFMWKISCKAIAQQPITGYGQGRFAEAYGTAQEAYFAKGGYSEQEELVAGSPEYAFNEYLQLAVEHGIPVLLCVLLFIGFCLWRGIAQGRVGACSAVFSLLVFAFSSYPMQLPIFIITFAFLLAACVVGRSRIALGVFALVIGLAATVYYRQNGYEASKEWARSRMLYHSGAYNGAKAEYAKLYPELKTRPAFLFEYGHCLHKLNEYEASNEILKEAATRSCDPMIFNIIAKNEQLQGRYASAEGWLKRSVNLLPGRIYPYYLLAKLYAEPTFYQPEKIKQVATVVLTKEPKVQSTAVKEMREEMKKLLKDVGI
ncbi:O-antigen ligase family protein [Bacteroides sp.]|uniref:O-antigen ligase family protein n=1 Tax=Bacteroides sp. TaxID=29523 RepID=UPI002FC74B77